MQCRQTCGFRLNLNMCDAQTIYDLRNDFYVFVFMSSDLEPFRRMSSRVHGYKQPVLFRQCPVSKLLQYSPVQHTYLFSIYMHILLAVPNVADVGHTKVNRKKR